MKTTSDRVLRMPIWKLLILKLTPAPAAYRPERYYMRGPGPKYREKHGRNAFDITLHKSKAERAGAKLSS